MRRVARSPNSRGGSCGGSGDDGIRVVFQSFQIAQLADDELVKSLREIAGSLLLFKSVGVDLQERFLSSPETTHGNRTPGAM